MAHEQWAIGLDPGFVQTGLALRRRDRTALEHHAVMSLGPGHPNLVRAVSLGDAIIMRMMEWVQELSIQRLDIAVETPIYHHNARSFELQWRLVQEVESGILYYLCAEVEECWITEVPPTTSKRLSVGRGDASKPEVASAAPLLPADFPDSDTLYTVADAWAHSLAAWKGCDECVRIDTQNVPMLETK